MMFSVILPLFNKAPYVEKAIQSVLSQTYGVFELIVVDDGSSDSSFEIAQRAIGEDSRCRIIHQDNAGVSAARNRGASESSGDYICFLDGDDWWDPMFLDRMLWLTREYPDAGIYGTNYYYVKNGRKSECVKSAKTGYIDYCKVYVNGMAMPLTSISVAVKPSVFAEFQGFKPSLKLGEDFDLWIRIALKYKVAFLNEPLAFYNQDSDPAWRGIGHLQEPRFHVLWNLGYLEEEERTNPDLKQLTDNLRTYSLFPYYLSRSFHDAARTELDKVDWTKQPDRTKALYKKPLCFLRLRSKVLKLGSILKQRFLRFI